MSGRGQTDGLCPLRRCYICPVLLLVSSSGSGYCLMPMLQWIPKCSMLKLSLTVASPPFFCNLGKADYFLRLEFVGLCMGGCPIGLINPKNCIG